MSLLRQSVSLLSLFASVACSSVAESGYEEGVARSAIVGGGEDATSAFPEFLTTVSNFPTAYCSAFLLSPTVALTAQACDAIGNGIHLTGVRTADGRASAVIDREVFSNDPSAQSTGLLLLRLETPLESASYAKMRTGASDDEKGTLVGQTVDTVETRTAHMHQGVNLVMLDFLSVTPQLADADDLGGGLFLANTHELLGILAGNQDCVEFGTCSRAVRLNVDKANRIEEIAAGWGSQLEVSEYLPTVTAPVVTVYTECGLTGASVGLSVGNYNTGYFFNRAIVNDTVSSVSVSDGYEIDLFTDNHQSGAKITSRTTIPCLSSVNFDNQASSYSVRAVPGAGVGGASGIGSETGDATPACPGSANAAGAVGSSDGLGGSWTAAVTGRPGDAGTPSSTIASVGNAGAVSAQQHSDSATSASCQIEPLRIRASAFPAMGALLIAMLAFRRRQGSVTPTFVSRAARAG